MLRCVPRDVAHHVARCRLMCELYVPRMSNRPWQKTFVCALCPLDLWNRGKVSQTLAKKNYIFSSARMYYKRNDLVDEKVTFLSNFSSQFPSRSFCTHYTVHLSPIISISEYLTYLRRNERRARFNQRFQIIFASSVQFKIQYTK